MVLLLQPPTVVLETTRNPKDYRNGLLQRVQCMKGIIITKYMFNCHRVRSHTGRIGTSRKHESHDNCNKRVTLSNPCRTPHDPTTNEHRNTPKGGVQNMGVLVLFIYTLWNQHKSQLLPYSSSFRRRIARLHYRDSGNYLWCSFMLELYV